MSKISGNLFVSDRKYIGLFGANTVNDVPDFITVLISLSL